MLWLLLLALPSCLLAQSPLLTQADLLCENFGAQIALAPSPPPHPQPLACLENASTWFSLDLTHLAIPDGKSALDFLGQELFWQSLKELGVEALYLTPLRDPFSFATAPRWGANWSAFALQAEAHRISLIGDAIGSRAHWGPDFEQALQNQGEYPTLFHLIEIPQNDWNLLPHPAAGKEWVNIPWLTLQELYKKGYVPTAAAPFTRASEWNATAPIQGVDGKVRRWIYLKKGKKDPLFAWLSPSFGASRIATAAAWFAVDTLGQKIFFCDGSLPPFAKDTLALWIRKIGAFSAEKMGGAIHALKTSPADLSSDIWTEAALLHALITEDAEALRLIYRLFLEEGIDTRRLIHSLQPLDAFAREWAEFLAAPKKKYTYGEEEITGEILRQRLLREDLYQLTGAKDLSFPLSTWPGYLQRRFGRGDAEQQKDEIQKAHLLLAYTYALQPGVFSFSAADLLGALPEELGSLDLFGPNCHTLYASLPAQLKSPLSFASQLKKIIALRREIAIAKGELFRVCPVQHPGCLLLLYRLPPNQTTLALAVNFSRQLIHEEIEEKALRHTTAIELLTQLGSPKMFEASRFSFELSPLSGKLFLFQRKHYE